MIIRCSFRLLLVFEVILFLIALGFRFIFKGQTVRLSATNKIYIPSNRVVKIIITYNTNESFYDKRLRRGSNKRIST
ncbi:hypothetical protein RIR_jg26733.t1 [Rhizophagus irregularis DAOM 181602=DAOM 197198]|nr:hypothetical protein RIR_jg26733.t1 [Rhizophagus irregularis DAOM 181602=DAOM 197198]